MKDQFKYIAIGPQVWGKADSPQAALRNMQRANNGHIPHDCAVYKVHPASIVDEVSGGISYPRVFGAAPVEVYRKRNGKVVKA